MALRYSPLLQCDLCDLVFEPGFDMVENQLCGKVKMGTCAIDVRRQAAVFGWTRWKLARPVSSRDGAKVYIDCCSECTPHIADFAHADDKPQQLRTAAPKPRVPRLN